MDTPQTYLEALLACYRPCPECGSSNIEASYQMGLCKEKACVACRDCGALLAWG